MTDFRRRARLRQARWRERHGFEVGAFRGRKIGSLLAPGPAEADGQNFLSPRVVEAVRHRVANPEPHQQLEPSRLWTNMLSSMPMCFNLFGELWDRPDHATAALKAWLGDMPGEVEELRFEWSPGRLNSNFLANRSAFDAAFILEQPDGTRGVVGVETKYHELAESEQTPGDNRLPRYEEVTDRSNVFVTDWRGRVLGTDLQQIWLDHLLVLSMLQNDEGGYSWGRFMLVYPEKNVSFARAADRYRKVLTIHETFQTRTLEQLLDAHVLPVDLQREFTERYLW